MKKHLYTQHMAADIGAKNRNKYTHWMQIMSFCFLLFGQGRGWGLCGSCTCGLGCKGNILILLKLYIQYLGEESHLIQGGWFHIG